MNMTDAQPSARLEDCLDLAYSLGKIYLIYNSTGGQCIWAQCPPLQLDNSSPGYEAYEKIGKFLWTEERETLLVVFSTVSFEWFCMVGVVCSTFAIHATLNQNLICFYKKIKMGPILALQIKYHICKVYCTFDIREWLHLEIWIIILCDPWPS